MTAALDRWQRGEATDDDVRWIDSLLKRGLLDNRPAASPQLDALVKEYREIEAKLPSPRIIPGIADGGPGIEQPLFVRGDCIRPGEATPRRYLEVLANSRAGFASPGSGRLELAERIASPDNPLTARVMVNRVWHHLFGTGLVATVDDFGHVGERPSHPELLDYLAAEFVADGWSVKRLIRRIVLSRTFQLASQPPDACRAKSIRRIVCCRTIRLAAWKPRRSAIRFWPRPVASIRSYTAPASSRIARRNMPIGGSFPARSTAAAGGASISKRT